MTTLRAACGALAAQTAPHHLVLIALFVTFAWLVPNYLSADNLPLLMGDYAAPALVAVALLVTVRAGGIDLSVGAVFALCDLAALVLFHVDGLPVWLVVVAVLGLGVAIGAGHGLLIATARMPPFLTTLATMLIVRGVYDLLAQTYAVSLAETVRDAPAWRFLGEGSVLGIPVIMLVLLVCGGLLHLLLTRTRFGAHLTAVGSDAVAARAAGVRVRRTRFLVYGLCATLVSLAGLLYAARQNAADSNLAQGWEIAALAAVVLGGARLSGGRGSVAGAMTGSGIMFLLSSGLLRLNAPGPASAAVIGGVLILAAGVGIARERRRSDPPAAGRDRPRPSSGPALEPVLAPLHQPSAAGPAVRLVQACKAYGGVYALDHVDIAVAPGEIHAVIGENGAGKSTLTRIIAGAARLDAGRLEIDGCERRFAAPADAAAAGVVMVYQESSLIPDMTVAQNLKLADETLFFRPRRIEAEARQALDAWDPAIDPHAMARDLGTASRQIVEIVRALHRDARIMIFDEPTTSLSPAERDLFFDTLRRLKSRGTAILFVTHALDEALALADRITVMRDGRAVACRPAQGLAPSDLVALMVGRRDAVDNGPAAPRPAPGPVLLDVTGIGAGPRSPRLSFALRAGEIVGLAGLDAAGLTRAAKIIAGVLPPGRSARATIRVRGTLVRPTTPTAALRSGILYVTGDRKSEGMFETLSVDDNVILGALARRPGWLYPRGARARRLAARWLDGLAVSMLHAGDPIAALSGGNQQKVVVARAMAQAPNIVLFDEPTRGVDIGSIPAIHAAIRRLAADGGAVLVISSSLAEIVGLSDRILIERDGCIIAEFEGRTQSEATIRAALTV